jgi:AcrR family transcriptional regulator
VLTQRYRPHVSSPRHRADPLAPDDRRSAIVAAITPLLVDRGTTVTSREMAEAAGVAEGTIFRVFPDKAAVIIEAIKANIDPTPVQSALAAIPSQVPMEEQVRAAADLLVDRSDRVVSLIGVLKATTQESGDPLPEAHRYVSASNTAILTTLAALFERHRDRLRVDPARAAVALRGLVFANAHPMQPAGERLSAADIADLLLRGIAVEG